MANPDVHHEQKTARLTRREALGFAWLASLTMVAGAGAWLSQRFARPQPVEGRAGGLFTVTPSEVPPPGAAPLNLAAGRLWLLSAPSGALALRKACTHLECLCEWDGQAREFVCPCHGSRFAEDGRHLAGPAARGLDRHPITALDGAGAALAQTDLITGAALPLPPQAAALVIDTGVRISGPPA
jgi:nitrite reductase/ring-hydroxylating ferredoxin subunit